jgi:hypothetical protein
VNVGVSVSVAVMLDGDPVDAPRDEYTMFPPAAGYLTAELTRKA